MRVAFKQAFIMRVFNCCYLIIDELIFGVDRINFATAKFKSFAILN